MSEKRGRPSYTWVKIHVDGILQGSINYQMSLGEQMIFVKLIAFSSKCGSTPGTLCDNDNRPIPDDFLAEICHAPIDTFTAALRKCLDEGRISRDEKGCLLITNWKHYQSEYQRQRPYREAKQKQLEYTQEGKVNNCIALVKIRLKELRLDVAPKIVADTIWEHFNSNGAATPGDSVEAVVKILKGKLNASTP